MKKYQPDYRIKKLYTDTYAISDNGLGQMKVFMYLLVGNKKALLIDSGFGLLDLKAIGRSIAGKEMICACTHGHIDHVLGAGRFEKAYLHSKDFGVYQKHTDPDFIRNMGMEGFVTRPPGRFLKDPDYTGLVEQVAQKHYPALFPLDEVSEFDLGERTVSWRLVPGHTQGSVVFIDEKYNTVFDSATTSFGGILIFPESSDLTGYLAALENYLEFLRKTGIEKRYTAHSVNPVKNKRLVSLIKCVGAAAQKPKKGIKIKTPFGAARAVFSNSSFLLCK